MKKIVLLTALLSFFIHQAQTMRLDSISSVDNNSSFIFNYNDNNINTGAEIYENNNGIWSKTGETNLSYDSNNLVSSEIYSNIDSNNVLVNNTKFEYNYNTDLTLDTVTMYEWVSSNVWQLIRTDQYSYNSGVLDEIIRSEDSQNYSLFKYIYENNILIKIENYNWDDDNSEWEANPWEKKEYIYDSNSNLTEEIEYYDFDGDDNWTIGDSKLEYQYNNSYDESNLILPFKYNMFINFLPIQISHMVINFKVYERLNSDWSLMSDLNYFYTDIALSTSDVNTYNYTVFPNPTTNQVKFDITDFEKIEIYDITGKLITKTKTNIVNMENVPNGTYLYRIQKGNETINGKIIKK